MKGFDAQQTPMKILLTVAAVWGELFTAAHPAFAQSWVMTSAPSTNWSSLATSADGSKLVAVAFGGTDSSSSPNGGIYASTDAGATWNEIGRAHV